MSKEETTKKLEEIRDNYDKAAEIIEKNNALVLELDVTSSEPVEVLIESQNCMISDLREGSKEIDKFLLLFKKESKDQRE